MPQEGSLYKDTFEPLIVRSSVNKAPKNAPARFSYLGAKNLLMGVARIAPDPTVERVDAVEVKLAPIHGHGSRNAPVRLRVAFARNPAFSGTSGGDVEACRGAHLLVEIDSYIVEIVTSCPGHDPHRPLRRRHAQHAAP